jgi:hypothetical protein
MLIINHNDRDIKIERVCQGLAWPSEKPGFVVVLGEALDKDEKGIRHLYFLEEGQTNDTGQLIRRCLEFKKKFTVSETYGRLHGPNMRFVELWNRDAGKKGVPTLYISEAPYVSEGTGPEVAHGFIEYHLNIVKDRLNFQSKTLHLLGSRLPYHLMEIQEPAKAKDTEHPAAAALCYVVSAMTVWQGFTEQDREVSILNTSLADDYDD